MVHCVYLIYRKIAFTSELHLLPTLLCFLLSASLSRSTCTLSTLKPVHTDLGIHAGQKYNIQPHCVLQTQKRHQDAISSKAM